VWNPGDALIVLASLEIHLKSLGAGTIAGSAGTAAQAQKHHVADGGVNAKLSGMATGTQCEAHLRGYSARSVT
jgi:hypothetical protein